MTDPDYTLIAAVLDRSGSIEMIREDVQGGLDAYIKDQKEFPGRCEFMLAQFDTQYEVVVPYTDIALVGSVTVEPRGATALLDAIGRTITDVGQRLNEMPEDQRPGHVIVPIITDGLENASSRFTRDQIFQMITTQRDQFGWEFIFLAANQDAIASGASLGMVKGSSLSYAPTSQGVGQAFASASAHTHSTRSGHSHSFSDSERKDAMDGQDTSRSHV
jgi:hypothetical protein